MSVHQPIIDRPTGRNPGAPDDQSTPAIAVLWSGCACVCPSMCLCFRRGWKAQKKKCLHQGLSPWCYATERNIPESISNSCVFVKMIKGQKQCFVTVYDWKTWACSVAASRESVPSLSLSLWLHSISVVTQSISKVLIRCCSEARGRVSGQSPWREIISHSLPW